MEESILNSVKLSMGLPTDYPHFDQSILLYLNTVLTIVNQLGAGESGFIVKSEKERWSDFIDEESLEPVKTYVCLKVRSLFDPPANSTVLGSMEKALTEMEFRISIIASSGGD